MNRKFKVFIFMVFIWSIFCEDTLCFSIEVKNDPKPGTAMEFRKLISLAPSITEAVYLLEAENRLIGCTTYCRIPDGHNKKDIVATVIDVNVERIVSLEPDLILAMPIIDSRQIEKLKLSGLNVTVFPQPNDFSEICRQFLEIGRVVKKEDKAKEIVNISRKKVNDLKNKIKYLKKPKVFIQIGSRPLVTITEDYFINDFIEFGGAINIAQGVGNGLYSRERVIEEDPDYIIIVTMGIVGEREKKVWGDFKTLKAVKNNNIYIVDSYKTCSPTPLSFADALEEIVFILHPELKDSGL